MADEQSKALESFSNDAKMLQGVINNSDMNETTKRQVSDRLDQMSRDARTAASASSDSGQSSAQEREAARDTVRTGGGQPSQDGDGGKKEGATGTAENKSSGPGANVVKQP